MIPKIVKTAEQYEKVLARIDDLMEAKLGTSEGDELELLTTLVELYEEQAFPIEMPTPIEAIKFRMEQAGLKQQDLVPFFGSSSKVSEVLSGKRTLSLSMIRALHQGMGISAEVLLQQPGATLPKEIEGDLLPENWPKLNESL